MIKIITTTVLAFMLSACYVRIDQIESGIKKCQPLGGLDAIANEGYPSASILCKDGTNMRIKQ